MIAHAIRATELGKCYHLYAQPRDRLKQFFWRGKRRFFKELWALQKINLLIAPGEVVGIIGRNGSGKSTLLQLICGTLTPTCGEIAIHGRLAALLELGAGFNPDFTGRENIWMNATIIGLTRQEIDERIETIVAFSGIGDFIDQPVKTYSSGMYVRLAFSIAINADPDILIIDEALSVGDGAFARKSFGRIMQLRDMGKTILFCSHSLFQVESLCNRAIWIDQGRLMAEGDVASVVMAYQSFLDKQDIKDVASVTQTLEKHMQPEHATDRAMVGRARLDSVKAEVDGDSVNHAIAVSGQSTLSVAVCFTSDPDIPCPTVGITFHSMDGRVLTSAGTFEDKITFLRKNNGSGSVSLVIECLPLLKGECMISAFLLCERGIHLYDSALDVAKIRIQQQGRLQGYFALPHQWHSIDEK
ncbi:MAG: ABC transporter ATP-binding protein [Nitrosomonas sp.]|nr:ABC transporter ATP-binding protein [Nitrosomonas sp.]